MYAADKLVDVVRYANDAGLRRDDIVCIMADGNGGFAVVYWAWAGM